MSPSGHNSRAGSPKIGTTYTVVNVRRSDTGTDMTGAPSEGALTIEGEETEEKEGDAACPAAEGASLLQHHAPYGELPLLTHFFFSFLSMHMLHTEEARCPASYEEC